MNQSATASGRLHGEGFCVPSRLVRRSQCVLPSLAGLGYWLRLGTQLLTATAGAPLPVKRSPSCGSTAPRKERF